MFNTPNVIRKVSSDHVSNLPPIGRIFYSNILLTPLNAIWVWGGMQFRQKNGVSYNFFKPEGGKCNLSKNILLACGTSIIAC